jgi:hypothetical protein
MTAFARTPGLPEATLVRALPAQLRRPRPRPAMSGQRRLQPAASRKYPPFADGLTNGSNRPSHDILSRAAQRPLLRPYPVVPYPHDSSSPFKIAASAFKSVRYVPSDLLVQASLSVKKGCGIRGFATQRPQRPDRRTRRCSSPSRLLCPRPTQSNSP